MLNYALMNCMNCGRKFDESVEGYAEFLPEENHWEAECGKCLDHYNGIVENRDILPDEYSLKSDIEELRELVFTASPIDDSDLPF